MSTPNRRAYVRARVEIVLEVEVGPFGDDWTLVLMTRDAHRAARDAAHKLTVHANENRIARVKSATVKDDVDILVSNNEKP